MKRWLSLAAAALLAVACDSTKAAPVVSGDAFRRPSPAYFRIKPVKVGERWGLAIAFLRNDSTHDVTLRSVQVMGPGVGSHVRVMKVHVAPLPPLVKERFATSGGIYKTYPPVQLIPGSKPRRCARQLLYPVAGFKFRPGEEARLLVLLRAKRPGTFRITEHDVTYERGSNQYTESLPLGLRGRIVAHGPPMRPDNSEQPCLAQTHVLAHS